MAEMVITELRRTGSGNEPSPNVFRWNSATHSSGLGNLVLQLKVNTKRQVPPGSDIPVEQVLGVAWEPFEVQGEWSDRWAGRGFAKNMEIEFSRLVGRTPLVRFQIDEESIVGLITELTITYRTIDQIGYKFTLSPHLNERVGEFRQQFGAITQPKPIRERVDEALAAFTALTELADAVKNIPVSGPDIADATSELLELEDAVDRAKLASETGISTDTERKLFVMASTFRRIQGAATVVVDSTARLREDVTLAFDDAIQIFKFEEWARGTTSQATRALGTARLAELDMRSKASKKPVAIHVAKQGESLERIALRYTGSADNWRKIYDANNLSSLVLEGGERLIIPARSS